MKRLSVINSFHNIKNELSIKNRKSSFTLDKKFDKILFLYFYLVNVLVKQLLFKKVKIFLKYLLNVNKEVFMDILKINFKTFSIKKVRKSIFKIFYYILGFYKKKINFFIIFIKKLDKVFNTYKKNLNFNILDITYPLLPYNNFNKNYYIILDKYVDIINTNYNIEKLEINNFFKFKLSKKKKNSLIKIIFFLKEKFKWSQSNNFKVILSFFFLKKKKFTKRFLNLLLKFNFNKFDILKSIISLCIKNLISNKISFLIKKKIIITLVLFIRKKINNYI
jgi:hypothetical protein